MKHNRIIALILLAFILWWGFLTTKLPETTMVGEPGPKFFPGVVLGLMALFTVLLFFIRDKKKDPVEAKAEGEEKAAPAKELSMREGLKLFGIFFLSLILMYYVGFIISMILGLTTLLWMIGWRIFPRAAIFSAVVTLVLYFLFDWLMRIPLPAGKLF